MGDRLLSVRKAENGFLVEITDQKISEKNSNSDGPYVDADREFVVKTPDDVIALVTKTMSGVELPKTDDEAFDSAFK